MLMARALRLSVATWTAAVGRRQARASDEETLTSERVTVSSIFQRARTADHDDERVSTHSSQRADSLGDYKPRRAGSEAGSFYQTSAARTLGRQVHGASRGSTQDDGRHETPGDRHRGSRVGAGYS